MKGRLVLFAVLATLSACDNRKVPDRFMFEIMPSDKTNIHFSNTLNPTKELNIMTYLYYFNGGGVGTGDLNNDGLMDLFFVGNISPSRIYLNSGDWQFRDITEESGVNTSGEWSTGVSIVDINNDGLLDIYVNQVCGFRDFQGRNRLFVCSGIDNGVPRYVERAVEYGLDFCGLATQTLFFDYDLDGDLDLFQLNHSVHENGTFGERDNFLGKIHPTSGDRLLRNDNGHFIDVTKDSGINSLVIGYGLGVAAGDINNDGWPDLYIGNDFHENDYLYINQRDGSFKDALGEQLQHTSRFSMGVDVADFNNDGHNDIVSLDMQPYDPIVLKSSLGEDEYSAFVFKLSYGYRVQFARNNLQLNNGDDTFSEIGMYAGIYATDWSWASLFLDFDNDGIKDLFVTNGIPARMNDIDYVNFRTSNEDHRWKTQGNRMEREDLEIIKMIPEIRFPNKFFRNNGQLRFNEINSLIKDNPATFSNGAAYADLDNDGDLDLITNNINDEATIYRNLTYENSTVGNNYISFKLNGPDKNRDGIGTRVIVHKGASKISYENFPVRGFQSSMIGNLLIGVGDTLSIDSVTVIWPDQTFQKIDRPAFNRVDTIVWKAGLKKFDFAALSKPKVELFKDKSGEATLDFSHEENNFIEFDRERLIPYMVSREGPALAVGDINNDGLDDVFFGSSKWKSSKIFMQTPEGTFYQYTSELIRKDSVYEDVDAVFEDIDNDGDKDLIIASGGNEFWGDSPNLKQRFYLNDGFGNFVEKGYFPDAFMTASCIRPHDIDNDGYIDFFIGGRAVPKSYGLRPSSYCFRNLGGGKFEDVSKALFDGFRDIGMVTDGTWTDLNGDGLIDLVLAVEWEEVTAFINRGDGFESKKITTDRGLWNFIYPVDGDGDGDIDLLVGNMGLNTRFTVNRENLLRLYVNDFDDNGQTEQILTYYVEGREIPFANHAELTKQLPGLKKKYLFAKDFSKASLEELFSRSKLRDSKTYSVNTLANVYLENQGNGEFVVAELPQLLQLSSVRCAAEIRRSAGGEAELIVAGNFYENNIDMGWYNASYGNVLRITKSGEMEVERNSLGVKGQVRKIKSIKVHGRMMFLLVRNNDSAVLVERVEKVIQ